MKIILQNGQKIEADVTALRVADVGPEDYDAYHDEVVKLFNDFAILANTKILGHYSSEASCFKVLNEIKNSNLQEYIMPAN